MKHIIIVILLCTTFLISVGLIIYADVVKYETFNRDLLTAQLLEQQLRHEFNDSNITLEIRDPGGVMF